MTESEPASAIGRALRALGRWLRGIPLVRRIGRSVRRALRAARGTPAPGRPVGPGTYPSHFRVPRAPAPITDPWPDPPVIDRPMATQREPAEPTPPIRYDLELFERLQADYAGQDLAATAPKYDAASIAERSRKRLTTIHERIGLSGMTALEIGCGAGYEVWYLAEHFGCDAWGIDVAARSAWPVLGGPRVQLIEGDMAAATGLSSDTFDRVVSFTVWEHITRPVEAILELYRVLKPGGLAVLRANLYRGPTASHLAREIAFPFPHLLFQDDVIAEALGRAGHTPRGAAWVNRLTWEQYESTFLTAGFAIRSLSFTDYPLDEAFYQRFEDVLGRYPRRDLERGFFQVTLEKPSG